MSTRRSARIMAPALAMLAVPGCAWYFMQTLADGPTGTFGGLAWYQLYWPFAVLQVALCAYGRSVAQRAGSRAGQVFYQCAMVVPFVMLFGPCLWHGAY